jgi:uncharacterized membrane protein YagU involved in acid resistance
VSVVWGALAGGAVGSTVVASGVRLAQELGWTRMDIPFLLGTIFTENRRAAAVVGYVAHLVIGLVFALLYAAVFAATGLTSWWFGLALGFVQAAFIGGTLANLLLPAVHPRMGTPWTDAEETPLLEPPGFMLVNYGRSTMTITLVLQLGFGAIVGAFAAGL